VLVPIWPGVTSALGCLLADIRYDDTWTVHQRLDQIDPARIRALYERMVERVMGVMREDEVPDEKVDLRYEAALQYEGQTHRVIITLPSAEVSVDSLAEAFAREYRERYGVTVDNVPVRLVNLRLRASAPRDVEVSIGSDPMRGSNLNGGSVAPMFFGDKWHQASIYHRAALKEGAAVTGPARIDQADTTTIVPPGWTARVDNLGNIAITHEAFTQ
jgi:N-methylhydantoinase A